MEHSAVLLFLFFFFFFFFFSFFPKTKLELGWSSLDSAKLDEKLRALKDDEAAAITHVFAHRNGLSTLPASLLRLKNLKVLDVSHNSLSELPDLSSLAHLSTIYLQGNNLAKVPSNLASLPALDTLWLEKNEALGEAAVNIGRPFHEDRPAVLALLKQKQ